MERTLCAEPARLTSGGKWRLRSRSRFLSSGHNHTAKPPGRHDDGESRRPEMDIGLFSILPTVNLTGNSAGSSWPPLPWHCRRCEGSRCRGGRAPSTGGRSRAEASRRAAGSRPRPRSRRGGRSSGSGGPRTAGSCCTSGRRKCLAGGRGCCCVAATRDADQSAAARGGVRGTSRASVTSCFPIHHFWVRWVQGGHFSSPWQL